MILGLFLVGISMIILLMPYALELEYHRHNQDDDLRFVIWVGSLPVQIRISVIQWVGNRLKTHAEVGAKKGGTDVDVDTQTSVSDVMELLRSPIPRYLKPIIGKLLCFLKEVDKFDCSIQFSTGESSLTAIAVGCLWIMISSLMGLINQSCMLLNRPQIQIIPSYGVPMVKLRLHCIFRVRLGHIIFETMKELYRKIVKRYGQRRVHA